MYAIDRGWCDPVDRLRTTGDEDGFITQCASGISTNFKIRDGSPFWHQVEAEPIPLVEKCVPPDKVQAEVLV